MDKRDILINLLGRETVSPAFDKAGKAADRFGDRMDATADDANRLDGEIKQAENALRDLAVQFARTSDAAERIDLTKAMRRQQAEIRKLSKARDLLPGKEIGADLAEQVSVSFIGRLGPLLARAPMGAMNPAVAAIGAPIAVGVATLVGTAIGGAIVGGVGAGGVAGGLALASRDPRVKAMAGTVGKDIGDVMGRASRSFVPETLQALGTVRGRLLGMEDDFEKVFGAASRHLDPLLDGLLDGAENALPGIITAVQKAGPVIDSFAGGIRRIGAAAGDSLSDLSEYADEGARALDILFGAVDLGIRVTSELVETSAEVYRWGEIIGGVMTGNAGKVYELAAAEERAKQRSEELASGLGAVGGAARDGATQVQRLSDVMQILNGVQLDANAAERDFQAAVDDARAAFNGKTRDLAGGTEKGRAYGAALDRIATSARTSAQAIYDQTGSQERANAKIEEGRAALIRQGRQYGMTEKEARAYANSVLAIPKRWTTTLDANTAAAIADVRSYNRWLASIPRTVRTRMITEQQSAKGGHKEFSHGGPVTGSGPKGVDSVPAILAPGEHVLTAREVDAAGGHDKIERIRALLRGEGGGATTRLSAAGQSAGGGASVVHHHTWNVNVSVPPTVNLSEVGGQIARALDVYWRNGGIAATTPVRSR